MKADDQRGISVVLFSMAFLFSLLGIAARVKSNFHGRVEISTTIFIIAAVLASFAIIFLAVSFIRKV
jgi:ABC-type multidrug transport system permease subunit